MADDIWMIEAVIQPFKLDAVTLALEEITAFRGVTVTECRGFGQDKLADHESAVHGTAPGASPERRHRGEADFIDYSAKVKLEIAVVGRSDADIVVATIARAAHTGRRGDGQIFVWPIARVVRVRTFDEGANAL